MVWDYTCSCTLAPSHIPVSSVAAGKIAERKEEAKLAKYSGLSRDYEVLPICVETLGAFGPSAASFFQDIGKKIVMKTVEKRASAFLRQSVGMAIQRGNALSVMGTVTATQKLEEIFYL